jgi:A/G-specific adenine glycosylase
MGLQNNKISPVVGADNIEFFRKRMIQWGRKNYSSFPWRKTKNPWHALVAEIMLQRTRAEQVVPVYKRFASRYPTAEEYANDSTRWQVFESLGLYWREKELRNLAKTLTSEDIPEKKEDLLKLPAVGNYIAGAYLSLHKEKREPIIDSNIVRLYGRFFGFPTHGETRRKRWFINLAERLTPVRSFRDYNYALLDFTRIICRPKPLCNRCMLNNKCSFFLSNKLKGVNE